MQTEGLKSSSKSRIMLKKLNYKLKIQLLMDKDALRILDRPVALLARVPRPSRSATYRVSADSCSIVGSE